MLDASMEDDDNEMPDETRIVNLCDMFLTIIANNCRQGPKTNTRIFEALEALAYTAVTLIQMNECSSCLITFFTRRFEEELQHSVDEEILH